MSTKTIEELRIGHFTVDGVDYRVAAWHSKADVAFVVITSAMGKKYQGKAGGYNYDRTLAAIEKAIKAMQLDGVACDIGVEEVLTSLVRIF